jgi:hypothetical protein
VLVVRISDGSAPAVVRCVVRCVIHRAADRVSWLFPRCAVLWYALPAMQRVSVGVFFGIGLAVVGWLYVQNPAHSARSASAGSVSAVPTTSAAPSASAEASPTGDLDSGAGGGADDDGSGDADALDLALPPAGGRSDAGATMPDGSPVPELGGEAPKSVHFGVVLVQYKGAQGAKRGTRDRAAADKLAAELATLAADDFEAAVAKGDTGSSKNAGRMFRGILEPAPEYALFSLDKGAVSEPIDTPRGLWIVKRLK